MSFDRLKSETGGPFQLLASQAVIDPFNAPMSKPLVPTVRGIFADGDMVIILFDAEATVRDGQTLSQYLHPVLSNQGRKGRQGNCVFRQ